MKKISRNLILILLGFICVMNVYAQETAKTSSTPQHFSLGPKIGLNIASATKASDNMSSKTGFCIGATAEFKISSEFGLAAELFYSQQGYTFENNARREIKVHLDYINLPVMGVLYFGNFNVKGGLQAGLLFSATTQSDVGNLNIKRDCNSLNIGMPLGVGYSFSNGVNIDLRALLN